jgi:Fe-Mn family superoxide dismutase
LRRSFAPRSHSLKAACAACTLPRPFKLPPLGYANEALEPHIDAQTMMIHHDRHHAAYVKRVQRVRQAGARARHHADREDAGRRRLRAAADPDAGQNNLGGHWNHTFFWDLMTPGGAKEPRARSRPRSKARGRTSPTSRTGFAAAAAARFGSGWAWLS